MTRISSELQFSTPGSARRSPMSCLVSSAHLLYRIVFFKLVVCCYLSESCFKTNHSPQEQGGAVAQTASRVCVPHAGPLAGRSSSCPPGLQQSELPPPSAPAWLAPVAWGHNPTSEISLTTPINNNKNTQLGCSMTPALHLPVANATSRVASPASPSLLHLVQVRHSAPPKAPCLNSLAASKLTAEWIKTTDDPPPKKTLRVFDLHSTHWDCERPEAARSRTAR